MLASPSKDKPAVHWVVTILLYRFISCCISFAVYCLSLCAWTFGELRDNAEQVRHINFLEVSTCTLACFNLCLLSLKIPCYSADGPLAQSAERGADTPGRGVLQLRRGREFEPLTDQAECFFLFDWKKFRSLLLVFQKFSWRLKNFFFQATTRETFSSSPTLLQKAFPSAWIMYQSNRRATLRAFEFLKNFCSNSPLTGPKTFSNAPIPGRITRLLVYFSVASIMLLKPAKAVHVNMVY